MERGCSKLVSIESPEVKGGLRNRLAFPVIYPISCVGPAHLIAIDGKSPANLLAYGYCTYRDQAGCKISTCNRVSSRLEDLIEEAFLTCNV
jgi:hypothetical protein